MAVVADFEQVETTLVDVVALSVFGNALESCTQCLKVFISWCAGGLYVITKAGNTWHVFIRLVDAALEHNLGCVYTERHMKVSISPEWSIEGSHA